MYILLFVLDDGSIWAVFACQFFAGIWRMPHVGSALYSPHDSGAKLGSFLEHTDVVWSLDFTRSSERLLSAGADGTVRCVDLSTLLPFGLPLSRIYLSTPVYYCPLYAAVWTTTVCLFYSLILTCGWSRLHTLDSGISMALWWVSTWGLA